MQGIGIMNYPDGSKYEGEFYENSPHGKGKLTNKNGEIFAGDFKNGNKTSGSIHFKNGDVYEGQFENNKQNGKGFFTT